MTLYSNKVIHPDVFGDRALLSFSFDSAVAPAGVGQPQGVAGKGLFIHWTLLAILSLMLILSVNGCAGAGRSLTPEAARAELGRRGIEYSPKSFVASAKTGEPDIIEIFIDAGMNPDARDDSGQTALMHAARVCNYAALQVLLERGASVNLTDDEGRTALHWAAQSPAGHSCVRALLDFGGDPNARTLRGDTPLMAAIYLPEVNRSLELLFLSNQFDTLATLLDRGADVNSKNQDGLTPLMRAAGFGNVRLVELLIDRGSDVNATDNRGRSAREIALRVANHEAARAIERAGG